MKELQREAEEARASRDDMAGQFRDNEKRLKNLDAEILQQQEDIAISERQRRAAEGERDDLQEELRSAVTSR